MRYDKLDHQNPQSSSFGAMAVKRYLPIVILALLGVSLYCFNTGVPETRKHQTKSKTFEPSGEVWDTMDGQGYQFTEEADDSLDPRFYELNRLPSCGDLSSASVQQDVTYLMDNVKKQFLDCITPIVNQWKGRASEMNIEWVSKASVCDKLPIFNDLKVEPFKNLHEIKWVVLPKCKEENIMVTLGVGHDTTAEERLNKTVPNTKFYGADPIIEPNRQMYSAFGKFFPFAIGKEPGFTKFRVLPNQNQKTRKYIYQDVTTIPFLYFLHDILKLKKIDFAWIDIEGGEFEFLDKIHNDVHFCQFNIEVHSRFAPAGAQIFHDFIFKVLEDQKYVFLKSMNTGNGVHRMFFLNVQDKACLAKYYNNY
uniref:Methyltransf_21 domain-containing protein n=2 Tax=Caenorhabditis tropicalis TaxID=1561998 RepID=A0A1I7T7L9_9PELO